MDESERAWAELLRLAELNSLSLATCALKLIEDPLLGTDSIREQLIEMIEQLEYGLARFEEFLV